MNKVLVGLEKEGMSGGIVPVRRLRDLQESIDSLRRSKLIDVGLDEAYLKGMSFSLPEDFHDARSIVVVATPVPAVRLHFSIEGKDLPVILPPTYAEGNEIAQRCKKVLIEAAGEPDARFERVFLPLKTLAARCGIVRYGRNNITYLPGKGSFHRLTALCTNLDLGLDMWQKMQELDRCHRCRLCIKACPRSAISEDRFLIRAERCLTFLNEKPSDVPFPNDVSGSWHNAIIGCMRCQEICPENREVKGWVVEGERFDEGETAILLSEGRSEARDVMLNERLERYGLDLTVFPRNLRAMLS